MITVDPIDLRVGDVVTVLDLLDPERESYSDNPADDHVAVRRKLSLQSLLGTPLEVIAIDLPFLAVRASGSCMTLFGAVASPVAPLDTRTVLLMGSSVDFVRAFRGQQ